MEKPGSRSRWVEWVTFQSSGQSIREHTRGTMRGVRGQGEFLERRLGGWLSVVG